jgi:hypothetical protein
MNKQSFFVTEKMAPDFDRNQTLFIGKSKTNNYEKKSIYTNGCVR